MKLGQPICGGHMPSTGRPVARASHPESHCTGCGRPSYVGGSGARVNPLVSGQCAECRAGWPCVSCGERHAFDALSVKMECEACDAGKKAA